ncbi:MAG: hypothetical protein U1F11_15250 [Steroidobacteraceae bacterium]
MTIVAVGIIAAFVLRSQESGSPQDGAASDAAGSRGAGTGTSPTDRSVGDGADGNGAPAAPVPGANAAAPVVAAVPSAAAAGAYTIALHAEVVAPEAQRPVIVIPGSASELMLQLDVPAAVAAGAAAGSGAVGGADTAGYRVLVTDGHGGPLFGSGAVASQDAGVVDAGGTMGRVVQVSVPADRLTQRGAEDDASGLLERRIELRSAAGTPIASWPARIKVQ